MLRLIKPLFAIVLIASISAIVSGQSRPRTATKSRTSSSKSKKPAAAKPVDTSASDNARYLGKSRVAEQIKVLTRFIYLLGGVAKNIEFADEAAKKNELSPAGIEQNEKSKTTVRTSLQNVRVGLDEIEIYFRMTPELVPYYTKLVGVASGAVAAEEQAGANQFDRAGRTLLGVLNRLTDVLVAMK